MRTRIFKWIITFTILTMAAGLLLPARLYPTRPASLPSERTGMLDLIVSASDTDLAAEAVSTAGGEVLSRLWLIKGVTARISADRLPVLQAYPGVRSIHENRVVKTADNENFGGRVTDRREIRGEFDLTSPTSLSPLPLPGDLFFFITESGKAWITTIDGTVQASTALPSCSFKNQPVAGLDGTIFVACENNWIFALNPDGTVKWKYNNPYKIFGGLALGNDGTLYTADEKRFLMAFDPASGQIVWKLQLAGDFAGTVLAPPVTGPDGAIYVTSKGDPSWLFAVDPSGSLKWSVSGDRGKSFPFSPILTAPGRVFVASTQNIVYAFNPINGSRLFSFPTASQILAQPVVATDGSLYVACDDRTLYGVNPDGTLRFQYRPASGHFKVSPLLSLDQSTIYAAVEEKTLYSVDTATGTKKWQYTTQGNIKASPVLDSFGNLIIGSEGSDLAVLKPGGKVSTHLKLADKIIRPIASRANGDIAIIVGDHAAAILSLVPDHWDGGPDVEPSDTKREWYLSNPIPIDIGADQLHNQGITGNGITVAVLDSGIYFNKHVEDILGTDLDRQYLGQADFVGTGTCNGAGHQYSGYCFSDHRNSIDRYGHGSHVAGIIWSQIVDVSTQVRMGVAPDANILSIRVLDENGIGTYGDVIEGIQYAVANKDTFKIRVLNMSLSAAPSSPYFADPLDRAVEQAWANGIVVVAAAGNGGPSAQSITVPGNDPYVITVGALNNRRTPAYWADDTLPDWASNGPTSDGFIKPDVIAPGSNVISFMYTDKNDSRVARLALNHPDFSRTVSLFRMSGTSMSTAVVSGVVALMLQVNPRLSPEQVKYRLKSSALPAFDEQNSPVFSAFQQGSGRIWVPAAALGNFSENYPDRGLDILADLAHGWQNDADLAYHYHGPVQRVLSDDNQYLLYYILDADGNQTWMGVSRTSDGSWVDRPELDAGQPTFGTGNYTWGGGNYTWGGGNYTWGGGNYTWGGGNYTWGGGNYTWGGGNYTWGGGNYTWGGTTGNLMNVSTTTWVEDH
ncbi:MAG: S8 family serine peptidase [Omnitrophica WOR_2 bacterium]